MGRRVESPSSINTFKQCPRKYYYVYVKKLETLPSIHLIRGKIVHSVLEDFFKVDSGKLPDDNCDVLLHGLMMDFLKNKWLEAKAEFADKVVKERDDLAIELAELQASLEKEECDGEVPVEYQEEVHEQFEADSPQAEFNRLRKEAKAQHAFSDQEAFNHVAENNPELADKLI